MPTEFFVTNPLGVEELVSRELSEKGFEVVKLGKGRVFFRCGDRGVYLANYLLKTVNKVFIKLAEGEVEGLREIYEVSLTPTYSEYLSDGVKFAVLAERSGQYEFTSLDIKRVVGQAVIDAYRRERGVRLKVDLSNPDVEVHAFLVGNHFTLGINTTGTSLHRRFYRVFNHKAAIKTTLAAAMLYLAEYSGEPLLDPLCGGGTVPIEAVHKVRGYPNYFFREEFAFRKLRTYDPLEDREVREFVEGEVNFRKYEVTCVDISPKAVEGAKVNASSAFVADTIRFILGDSERRETLEGVNAIKIVTNPPYGMRSHSLKKIRGFYERVLRNLRDLYPGSDLVAITSSFNQFRGAAESLGIKVVREISVMHGGLPAKVFKLKL